MKKTRKIIFHIASSRLLCYSVYQLPAALVKHYVTTRILKRAIQSYQYACPNGERCRNND